MSRNETTGPTSLNISISCSSVMSYGMLPTNTTRDRDILQVLQAWIRKAGDNRKIFYFYFGLGRKKDFTFLSKQNVQSTTSSWKHADGLEFTIDTEGKAKVI